MMSKRSAGLGKRFICDSIEGDSKRSIQPVMIDNYPDNVDYLPRTPGLESGRCGLLVCPPGKGVLG